jgi:hypothetical protein
LDSNLRKSLVLSKQQQRIYKATINTKTRSYDLVSFSSQKSEPEITGNSAKRLSINISAGPDKVGSK